MYVGHFISQRHTTVQLSLYSEDEEWWHGHCAVPAEALWPTGNKFNESTLVK